jgi:hypothetical protein
MIEAASERSAVCALETLEQKKQIAIKTTRQ